MAQQGKPSDISSKINEMQKRAILQGMPSDGEDPQLPIWEDHVRALPNDYARSALFTVRNKRAKREALQNQEIFTLHKDVSITYTGIELRANDDELIWQQVLDYAKHFSLGKEIEFTLYQLCKDLGWGLNGRNYRRIEDSLTRMQATAIRFVSNRIGSLDTLSMIERFHMTDRGTRRAKCLVKICREILYLFAGDYFTRVLWHKYRDLSPIARRLFDYVASHKQPHPLTMQNFKRLCDSQCKDQYKWGQMVAAACEELQGTGLVKSVWVVEGRIVCERAAPQLSTS